jgi:hypothetical protein
LPKQNENEIDTAKNPVAEADGKIYRTGKMRDGKPVFAVGDL